MKTTDSARAFKILAWLGVLLIILLLALPKMISIIEVSRTVGGARPAGQPAEGLPPNEPLGELGSRCGGPLRLPCRPGLQCSVDHGTTSTLGLCERPEGAGEARLGQLGDACGAGKPYCVSGLYCKGAASAGACTTFAAGAPKIESIKLADAQFSEGWYFAEPDTAVFVTVTAVNAAFVDLRYGDAPLGKMEKGQGGTYTANVFVKKGPGGDLIAVVTAKNGDTAALSVKLASTE